MDSSLHTHKQCKLLRLIRPAQAMQAVAPHQISTSHASCCASSDQHKPCKLLRLIRPAICTCLPMLWPACTPLAVSPTTRHLAHPSQHRSSTTIKHKLNPLSTATVPQAQLLWCTSHPDTCRKVRMWPAAARASSSCTAWPAMGSSTSWNLPCIERSHEQQMFCICKKSCLRVSQAVGQGP